MSNPTTKTLLLNPLPPSHLTKLLPQIVSLHAACITQPTHTIATFLPPLNLELMTEWWRERAREIEAGERAIIICLEKATEEDADEDGEVAGVVMLSTPFSQTGPFRASVEKLLVRPQSRRKGISKLLMEKLEEVATERGRWLLMLDTEKGSPAEVVYPRLGYIKIGEVPTYEISPLDGSLKDGVFFYKDLRKES